MIYGFNSKANKLRHAIFAEDYGLKNSHTVNFIKSYEKPVATFIESEQSYNEKIFDV